MTATMGTKLICVLWTVVKSGDSPFQSPVTVLVPCDQEGQRKSNNKDTFLIINAGS